MKYNKQEYELAVVLGISNETGGMNPHGMAHYLSKHTYTHDDNTRPTEEDLIKASSNVQGALNYAIKKNNVIFHDEENKLIFSNGIYVYVICLAKDEDELNYIHTLFKDEHNKYIKRKKKEIRQKRIRGY